MNWINNFVLIVVSTALSLILLEVGVRIIVPETVLFNRFHETVHYGDYLSRRLRPNTTFFHTSEDGKFEFRTNSNGFRMDYDVELHKNPNTIRVMVLGDSHAQGFEVQQSETFSDLLNGKNCNGRTLEIVNTSVSGSGTSEHFVTLQHYFPIFNPDVVVEAFFPNDLDNNENAFHRLRDGVLEVQRFVHPATNGTKLLAWHNNIGLLSFLSQNSYAYSAMMNFVWSFGRTAYYGKTEKFEYVNLQETTEETKNYKIQKLNAIFDAYTQFIDGRADFIIIAIPDIKPYDMLDYLEPKNMEYFFDIEFDNAVPLHVLNGHRHINARAHSIIADNLYKKLCVN